MHDRFAQVRYMNALDPERDCHKIHRTYSTIEFPWDYGRGLEIALLKTCCVPSISATLQQSGHFTKAAQKRYDDTRILLGEIVKHGYDAPRGRQALRRINRAHRGLNADNDDMLYVLSTFIYEPVRWIDRWAWRKVTQVEKLGSFYFFREIGLRMNITSVPTDYAALLKFNENYERRRFQYELSNERVGTAVLRLYSSWYPRPIDALVAATLPCRLDQPTRRALGLPEPGALPRGANWFGLKAHGLAELIAPRTIRKLMTRPAARTYPGYPRGYDLSEIGSHVEQPPAASETERIDTRESSPQRRNRTVGTSRVCRN